MSKFINKKHSNTISSIIEGTKKKLQNPYYLFTDKKATIVTYYNANINKTTFEKGSGLMQSYTDEDAPLKFNKIENAYLFGINRAEIDLQLEEFGLESSSIEGDAYVMPNTFVPYPQDYFYINYMDDHKVIFKVTNVTKDTFENHANAWKINYKLSLADGDETKLDDQVEDSFIMNINSIGTNLKCIIQKSSYQLIEELEDYLTTMKNYYENLFFKNTFQTFIYENNGCMFYDPYMIEFIKRNKILEGGDKYIYVGHQTSLSPTFSIDYDNTFFRSLEKCDKKHVSIPPAYAVVINDRSTLFYQHPDNYFEISYRRLSTWDYNLPYVEPELLEMIVDKKEYSNDNDLAYNNIIIRYFNNIDFINEDIINILHKMSFEPNIKMYYAIPIIIFILEQYIRQIMKK